MKAKNFVLTLFVILLSAVISGCSDKKDYDPNDYVTSILSGEYGKGELWKLSVTVNDEPLADYGHVRFESKTINEGDFTFVDVIPGEKSKTFKAVPLRDIEDGIAFTIEYVQSDKPVIISGLVSFGEMTVDIKML